MENKDFYKWQDQLMKELTTSEFKVYMFIYNKRDNKTGAMTYKQATIAKSVGLGTATISRVIKSLKNKGYIIISKLNKVIGNLNKYICNVCWNFTKTTTKTSTEEVISELDKLDMEMLEVKEEKQDFTGKIIANTDIKTISNKQKGIINTFTIKTILETIIIAKKKKCKTATFFINLLSTEAIKNGTITSFQIKILKIILP